MKLIKAVFESENLAGEIDYHELKKVTFSRRSFFENEVLESLEDEVVRSYAEANLNMIDCDDIPAPTRSPISHFDDHELIEALKLRGYAVAKCQTLADTMKIEELIHENLV